MVEEGATDFEFGCGDHDIKNTLVESIYRTILEVDVWFE